MDHLVVSLYVKGFLFFSSYNNQRSSIKIIKMKDIYMLITSKNSLSGIMITFVNQGL